MSFDEAAGLLCWAGLLLAVLALAGLARRVRALEERVPELGLPAGARAPALDRLSVAPDGPSLLLFLSSSCNACPAVLDQARVLAAAGPAVPVHAIFPKDPLPVNGAASAIRVHAGEQDLLTDYRVPATPFAVLVESGRVRRAEPVRSPDLLHELITPAAGR